MRLVYLGSPAMAVPPLEALVDAGHDVVLVVSNPDRRRGRRGEAGPTPVKQAALAAGLAVTDDPDDVLSVQADLGVVVAYGRIIRPHVLAHLPMVNLHFSLLPRWRGAAPVERAILAGDRVTGVCVMDVAEGLDTGGVHARAEVPIGTEVTAGELRAELVEVGTRLLVDTLGPPDAPHVGLGRGEPQPEVGVTYAEKLSTADRQLRWDAPAVQLSRVVRVGGAWTTYRQRRFKVLAAELVADDPAGPAPAPGELAGDLVGTGDGLLRLREVQPEGRPAMTFEAWANGAQPGPGERLGP